MSLLEQAILIDNRLWVTTKYLENLGISKNTIKSGYKRYRSGKGNSWEPHLTEKLGLSTLIAYDTIPPEQTTLYGLPSQQSIVSELTTVECEEIEIEVKSIPTLWKPFYKVEDAIWFQTTYNVNAGRANGRDRSKELAIACAILRMLNTYSTKKKIATHTGFDNKSDLYASVCNYIAEYGENGLYEMPATYRWLRPKVSAWNEAEKHHEEPRLVFNLERNQGNDHALKFTKEHQVVFMEYYLNPRGDKQLGQKLPMLTCHRNYMYVMKHEFGLAEEECVDVDAIRQHFNKTRERKQLVSLSRNGTTYFDSHVMPYIIGKSPQYSFSLVAGDGWMPGRTVITRRKVWNESKQAYVIQKRAKGVNVWIWYDWKSKAIISWRLSPTETSETIRKSFRDILSFWGVVPGSVMIDTSWSKQMDVKHMFEKAGVTLETKKPYTPQTSIAERNNKEVNKYYREEDAFWVNMDTNTHTINFKHNENWVRGAAPIEEEDFLPILRNVIERYNNTPLKSLEGKTPLEMLETSINPACRKVDVLESNFIFGDRRGPISVKRCNFEISIATKKYHYAIGFKLNGFDVNGKAKVVNNDDHIRFDRTVRPSEKVLVYFDEKHMNTVDIYSYLDENDPSTHRYMMTAVKSDLISVNRASFEEHPGRNKALQDKRKAMLDENYDELLKEQAEGLEEWDVNTESLAQMGQERTKERMSSDISRAYGKHHFESEYEDIAVLTKPNTKQKRAKIDINEKRRLLEAKMAKLNSNK